MLVWAMNAIEHTQGEARELETLLSRIAQGDKEALGALYSGMTLDALWVCVQSALGSLCELDGVDAEETMIEGVFRNFCVGK